MMPQGRGEAPAARSIEDVRQALEKALAGLGWKLVVEAEGGVRRVEDNLLAERP
jgi:hypothetical protein